MQILFRNSFAIAGSAGKCWVRAFKWISQTVVFKKQLKVIRVRKLTLSAATTYCPPIISLLFENLILLFLNRKKNYFIFMFVVTFHFHFSTCIFYINKG